MAVLAEMVGGSFPVDAQPTGEICRFSPPQLQLICHLNGRIIINEFSGNDRQMIVDYGVSLVNLYSDSDNAWIVLCGPSGKVSVYHRGCKEGVYPKILGQLDSKVCTLPAGTKVIRYLEGGHPELGEVTHDGIQDTETVQEIHLISI